MRRQAGFTLVEALIVIAIIGILAAIAIPAYIGFQNRASDSLTVNALGIVRTALEMYPTDYAITANGLGSGSTITASRGGMHY